MASMLVQALQDLGYHEQAQELAGLALKLARTSFGDEDEYSLAARTDLAASLDFAGKFSEAEEETRIVLRQRKSLLGPTNPATLTSMKNLAMTIEHQGRHGEAEALYRELIDIQTLTETPYSKAMLATKQNLAVSLQTQGKLEEAYNLFQQVLDGRIQQGESTLAVYYSMSNVGCSLWGQNRVDEAWETHSVVFSRCEQDLGRDNPQTIRSMTWMALILQSMGDKYFDEAERYWTESLDLYRARLGRQHPDTLRTQRGLVTILHERGRQGRALRVCQDLYELTRKHREFGPRHPDFLDIKDHQKQLIEEIAEAKSEDLGSWPPEPSFVHSNL
ncbi:hypothetical protein GGS24DRAFT_502117 [Hypoxylon argillaceum]|nr:hypothetical protein GGS24DRAFT_502117 [Hypoxylon argillaceum]